MKRKYASVPGLLLILLLAGCSVSSGTRSMKPVVRQATDVPARFEAPAGITMDENSCKNPLSDPRDGTKITLYTAEGGVGDYEVPPGKYGVQEGELLRVNCSTGEVTGIVRR